MNWLLRLVCLGLLGLGACGGQVSGDDADPERRPDLPDDNVSTAETLVSGPNLRLVHAGFWLRGFAAADAAPQLGALRIHDGDGSRNCDWSCAGASNSILVYGYYNPRDLSSGTFVVGADADYHAEVGLASDPKCQQLHSGERYSLSGGLELRFDSEAPSAALNGSIKVQSPPMSGSFNAEYCGTLGSK